MDRPTAGHDNSTIGRPALCTPRRRLFTGRSVFIYIIIVQLPLLASGPKVPVDVLKKKMCHWTVVCFVIRRTPNRLRWPNSVRSGICISPARVVVAFASPKSTHDTSCAVDGGPHGV